MQTARRTNRRFSSDDQRTSHNLGNSPPFGRFEGATAAELSLLSEHKHQCRTAIKLRHSTTFSQQPNPSSSLELGSPQNFQLLAILPDKMEMLEGLVMVFSAGLPEEKLEAEANNLV